MINAGVEFIPDDLRRFGETDTAEWLENCTEKELVIVASVATWLTGRHGTPQEAPLLAAEAGALAAVYVHEGHARPLARASRAEWDLPRSTYLGGRRPDPELQDKAPRDYGIRADLRARWPLGD